MSNPLEVLAQVISAVQESGQGPDVMGYIMQNEGFDKTIRDDNDNPTIGSGINLKNEFARRVLPKEVISGAREITEDENLGAIGKLIPIAARDAKKYFKGFDNLNEDQKTALIDMSYNLGLPGLKSFDGMLKALNEGNFERVAFELLDSDYATQVQDRAIRNASKLLGQPIDVRAMQEQIGVTVDGKYGPKTRAALKKKVIPLLDGK